MITSRLLENELAPRTMIAHMIAAPNRRIASRASFFCRGVPTLTPRKAPTTSPAVSPQAWAYRWGFGRLPSSLRFTGRTREFFWRRDIAIDPISVYIPVAKTTPRARPLVTVAELKAMLRRSPGPVSSEKVASESFCTGRDSPVKSASSVSKLTASMILRPC